MMAGRIITLALLIFLIGSFDVQAQTRACTEVGCVDGLTLHIDPDYEWKWGNYDLYFSFGGKSATCRGRLPLKPCDDGPTFHCGGKRVTIDESGCALPESQHAISDIHIDGDPPSVSVIIKHNGQTILTRSIVAEYQILRPNGLRCEPTCKAASYSLFTAQ